MNEYEKLVHSLINAPMTSGFRTTGLKSMCISHFAESFFGGVITIPSIIVAGTKGKGSTCAVAESVLRESGLRTGLFTSPHLVTPRERIWINGSPISEELYLQTYKMLIEKLEKLNLSKPPFFALHTFLAGLLFNTKNIDCAVIECGIGGRFDWTKIFQPTVAGITHLEFDHTKILGSTPFSISWNKFGIFTKSSKNFSVPQSLHFQNSLNILSKQTGIKFTTIPPNWHHKTGITGPCANENTTLGVVLAKELCKSMNYKKFEPIKGAENAKIFGRFQEYDKDGIKWLLDGAHTTDSITKCNQWYETKKSPNDVLLCATTKERNPNELLKILLKRKWKQIIYVERYNKNFKMKNNCYNAKTLKEAIEKAMQMNPTSILVTGSLHLVGDVMKEIKCFPF